LFHHIDDLVIETRFSDSALAERFSRLVQALGFKSGTRPFPRFIVSLELKSINAGQRDQIFVTPAYSFGSTKIFSENGFQYLTYSKSKFSVNSVSKSGAIEFDHSFWQKPFYAQNSFLIMGLILLFWQYGYHELHGAALAKNGKGLLIIGPSGSGKSTLAVSLILEGWGFLTDDLILLYMRERGVEALTIRKYFKIDMEVLKKYPELSKISSVPVPKLKNKAFLYLDEVFKGKQSYRCTPEIIIFPQITHDTESRLVPMRQSNAFINLLLNNCYNMFLEKGTIKKRLNTMESLMAQAESYELSLGLDLYEHPEKIYDIAPMLRDF
jgi:hypothetical protein